MEDSISRQAAIEAIEREKSLIERPITETRWFDLGLRKAEDVLSELPSVQPDQIEDWKSESVKALDRFTKAFCRDKQVKDDLKFRCSKCDFEMSDKTCLVKVMARKLCPEYKDFGSMGDL